MHTWVYPIRGRLFVNARACFTTHLHCACTKGRVKTLYRIPNLKQIIKIADSLSLSLSLSLSQPQKGLSVCQKEQISQLLGQTYEIL